jgi:hypothetical protein
MVNGIETSIDAVNGVIEWQDMNTAKQTRERSFKQLV